MSHSGVMRRRLKLARAVDRATVVELPVICGGSPYLVHPSVTAACACSLHAIAAFLRDGAHPVATESLDAARAFICDGRSSFFGRDAPVARRDAAQVEHAVAAGAAKPPSDSGLKLRCGGDSSATQNDAVPIAS